MRKIGWYAVSASVGAFVVGCVLLLAANLYVQSQAVQQRIRQALSAALRMPVSVKKTTVTPWEGLRIDGLTARPDGAETLSGKADVAAANYLLASSFRVRFDLWSLLTHKGIVIDEVLLDQPKVAWAQDGEGRWQLPAERGTPRKKSAGLRGRSKTSPSPSPTLLPDETPSPSPAGSVAVQSPAPILSATPVALAVTPTERPMVALHSIEKIRLRHGDLAFLNNRRRQVGHFEEVDMDGRLADPEHAAGTVEFAKVSLPRVGLMLTNFQSDFAYGHDAGLDLSHGHAQLAGGQVSADYHLHTAEPQSPFTLQCRLDNIGLGQLIHEAGSRMKLVEGRLQGELQASGLSDDPASRSASGQIQLLNARVRDFPVFRLLGEMLRIEDLSHMEFKKAQLDYRLDGTVLQVNPLVLVSNDLRITAQGKYLTDDDRLDLHARLTVDEAVSRQLPPSIMQQFQPDAGTPGSRFIDFDVTGPVAKPKTDLYKRILVPEVSDLLQSFLSSKPKTPKDKFLKRATPSPLPPPTDPPVGGPEP